MTFFYEFPEYIRPWKLTTLFVGIGLLVLGSVYTPAPDWDITISFIMAFITYLTAPWSMRVLLERRWRHWPAMLFATWFSVDGCYALYWYFKSPTVLAFMREANFPVSLALYGICGIIWLFVRFYTPSSARHAITIGLAWCALTVAFEFLFFHFVGGHSWLELFANYNIFEGRVWVVVLLWIAAAPYVFFQFRRQN